MDDLIPDSPKRRKLSNPQNMGGLDSADESEDDLLEFDTVATLPLQRSQYFKSTQRLPSQSQRVTQPTQIIDRSISDSSTSKDPVVQVAASSPLKPPSIVPSPPNKRPGGILASTMAPPGTAFRPPHGVTQPPSKFIDLIDDEEPTYQGDSSDEESQMTRSADIKPSTFTKGGRRLGGGLERVEESPVKNGTLSKFHSITSNSFYTPLNHGRRQPEQSTLGGPGLLSHNGEETPKSKPSAMKRSADVMANAYASGGRQKLPRQTGPSPAKPAQASRDRKIEDIADYQVMTKVKQMQHVLPAASVSECETALMERKGNFDDALEYVLLKQEARAIDLTGSDDELSNGKHIMKAPVKQQLKVPTRTIQEKWSSTQNMSKPTVTPRITTPRTKSPTPKKPRGRRLIRGRKQSSPPVLPSPNPTITARESPIDIDSESESERASSDAEQETEVIDKVLDYINTCSVNELTDLASVKRAEADFLLAQKPFKSLDDIRAVRVPATGKGTRTKAIGDKVVDRCQDMWLGYETVDLLVKHCEALGQPIAEDMKKWGINVFGKEAELELFNFKDVQKKNSTINESGLATPAEDADVIEITSIPAQQSRGKELIKQPAIMNQDMTLKDYQIVGINWLALLFRKKLSCILADDMGLGKTCQVIGFLAHLCETGVKGPHLVVVPPATLENWLREFSIFCPNLKVEPYYGSLNERPEIRLRIEKSKDIDVVVTTYHLAKQKDDNKWLRRREFCVCVYDEGHMLKNSKSESYTKLIKIPAHFRLLLTGTPLQNNLIELVSLLAFIMPEVFQDHKENLDFIFSHKAKTTDENHDALLSAQRVARARSMLKPFVLRRKKHQVLATMPKKTRRVEYCQMNQSQIEIYKAEEDRVKQILLASTENHTLGGLDKKRKQAAKAPEHRNNIMKLRQAAIHPLLFRRIFDDEILRLMSKACLREEAFVNSDSDLIYEDMSVMTDSELHYLSEQYPASLSKYSLKNEEWLDSGKVSKLRELLFDFTAKGDRTLVFSQFTLVLDILDYAMETWGINYFRLDGKTKVEERQEMIDEFSHNQSVPVMLLSTKAGGTGINLACANKVIIFDMSFNPQDDIQAENRAHRVGSTRDVEVIRLVTKGTIEEDMFRMGETKLMLDERVAGVNGDRVEAVGESEKAEAEGEKQIEELMMGKLGLLVDNHGDEQPSDKDIHAEMDGVQIDGSGSESVQSTSE